jgi:hypothetical protein
MAYYSIQQHPMVDAWRNLLFMLEAFVDRFERQPLPTVDDASERSLARWMHAQRINYPRRACAMSNPVICSEWEQACARHPVLAW